jgi:hypothetical protein
VLSPDDDLASLSIGLGNTGKLSVVVLKVALQSPKMADGIFPRETKIGVPADEMTLGNTL